MSRRPSPEPLSWWRRAALPQLTIAFFVLFAAVLWANAVVNRYRFNVAVAALATVPLVVLLVRGAVIAGRPPAAR